MSPECILEFFKLSSEIDRIRTLINRGKANANLRAERIRIREPSIGRLRDIVAFRHLRSIAGLRVLSFMDGWKKFT